MRPISKEKARETSIAHYCQNCAERRKEPESAQNGASNAMENFFDYVPKGTRRLNQVGG